MKLNHCKLSKSHQKKLLELFLSEVLPIYSKFTPILLLYFTIKARLIISHYFELEAREMFDGLIEIDESSTSVKLAKESVVVELLEKLLYLAFSSAAVMFIPKSLAILKARL